MSDSEDEAAFASADEGETTGKAATEQKPESKDSSSAAAAAAQPVKKDTGQSKQQKKKGKKGGKKNTNENKKPESAKTESAKPAADVKTEIKPKEEAADKTESKSLKTEDKMKAGKAQAEKEKTKTEVKTKTPKADKAENDTKEAMENKKTDGSETKGDNSDKDQEVKDKPDSQKSGSKLEEPSTTPKKSAPTPPQLESPDTQSIPRATGDGDTSAETEKSETEKKESGGWGWGSWGSSLLTAASSSVSTFTSQVGEGFNTIVDSVESSLGAPAPEEIAKLEAEQEEKEGKTGTKDEASVNNEDKSAVADGGGDSSPKEEKTPETAEGGGGGGGGWFSSLGVSSITSKIQNTGKSLVSGSLDAVEALATGSIDVLENIGKKTINVLSDHDPGFKKTKNVLFEHGEKKQNLSSLLREAKEKAEEEAHLKEEQEEARKHNYGAVFDDFQGLAHLEALEILSNQSEKKVQVLLSSLPQDTVSELKPHLIQIKSLFELDDSDYEDRQEHDFSKLITDLLSELHLGTTPDKLNKVQQKNRQWIIDFYAEPAEGEEKKKIEPKEIFHAAISALAELTAKSVEQFHKAGELVLLQKDSDTSFEKRSKSLCSLTQVLCTEVSILSTKFTQCLHKAGEDAEDPSVITPFVTNVYLEASNSSTYIQDGFQLLLPVLQQAAIQNSPLLKS